MKTSSFYSLLVWSEVWACNGECKVYPKQSVSISIYNILSFIIDQLTLSLQFKCENFSVLFLLFKVYFWHLCFFSHSDRRGCQLPINTPVDLTESPLCLVCVCICSCTSVFVRTNWVIESHFDRSSLLQSAVRGFRLGYRVKVRISPHKYSTCVCVRSASLCHSSWPENRRRK